MMKKEQSFWKGSAILLGSAMLTKVLGACFKIPLTNVLGGTGMGYFSCAYGLFLPIYALSITGLSASVAQTAAHAAVLRMDAEVRRICRIARATCGVFGLLLSIGIFLLAEPLSVTIAAQPYALFSVAAIAPAALFGCLTAVERGYWEGMQNMTPTAVSQAVEAVAKLGLGLFFCQWTLNHPHQVCAWVSADVPLSALAAAAAVFGVTLSTAVGWLYFMIRGICTRTKPARTKTAQDAASVGQILRRLLYVMIPVALGSLVTNLTSLLGLVTMMRCLGRVQQLYPEALIQRFGAVAARADFPAFVYGSFTGMAVTVFNLVPSVTNMLRKSTLPCAAALWARSDRSGVADHARAVVIAAAAMVLPCAGALAILAKPVMQALYSGRPEEAVLAAQALQALLPDMVYLCLVFPLCSVLQWICKAAIPVECMLVGVAVKLVGNLTLISQPRFCICDAGIARSACYFVMLLLIFGSLRRALEQSLHLAKLFLWTAASAALCTAAVWICQTATVSWRPVLSLTCCVLAGGAVYLPALWIMGRRRKIRADLPLECRR